MLMRSLGLCRVGFRNVLAEIGPNNLFMLGLLVFLTGYALTVAGFTTNDDAVIAIAYGSGKSAFEVAISGAQNQGRFNYLWGMVLMRVPYLFDNTGWYVSSKVIALLGLLLSMFFMIREIFKSTWVAMAVLLLFLTFLQNGWEHNGFTSYPFAFSFFASCFMTSLGLFCLALEQKSRILAAGSAVFFFLAMGIELFAVFTPLFFLLAAQRGAADTSAFTRLKENWVTLAAPLLALVLYLAGYVLWRRLYPSTYDGNNFGPTNLLAAIKVITAYSMYALPISSLRFITSQEYQLFVAQASGLRMLSAEISPANILRPVIGTYLLWRLFVSNKFTLPNTRTLGLGLLFGIACVFAPNLLLGFVERHQVWVTAGSRSYLYTYYSYISLAVCLALLLAFTKRMLESTSAVIQRTVTVILLGIIFLTGSIVELRNMHIANDQKLSNRKWQLMSEVVRSTAFSAIPDGTTIVATTLEAHTRGIAAPPASYWSDFTRSKTGKNVNFSSESCGAATSCYLLVFRQQARTDKQFVVLGRLTENTLHTVRDATLFVMPAAPGSTLIGSFVAGAAKPEVTINGAHALAVAPGFFSVSMPFTSGKSTIQSANLTGNVDLIPGQLTISDFAVPISPGQPSLDLGPGFFAWEGSGGARTAAWGGKTASIMVTSFASVPQRLTIQFEATALQSTDLKIQRGSEILASLEPGEYKPVSVAHIAPPGVSTLTLQIDKPAIRPSSNDTRLLGFQIRNLVTK